MDTLKTKPKIMKTVLSILANILFLTVINGQDIYKITESNVHFFSEAPLENIEADNSKCQGLIKPETKQVAIIIPIIEFKFEKPLMEEHFNENYMETSKFKTASFQGKIISEIDFSKAGKYEATAEGELKIHGVSQKRKISGELEIKDGSITLNTKFNVALEDHDIEIPKMVIENLAETIEVDCMLIFEPKK